MPFCSQGKGDCYQPEAVTGGQVIASPTLNPVFVGRGGVSEGQNPLSPVHPLPVMSGWLAHLQPSEASYLGYPVTTYVLYIPTDMDGNVRGCTLWSVVVGTTVCIVSAHQLEMQDSSSFALTLHCLARGLAWDTETETGTGTEDKDGLVVSIVLRNTQVNAAWQDTTSISPSP